ncbi:hypothetical protein LB506_010703 [Fusarium annulatum]|nr:hypothetical protein LB506_010703 [Fusarium annulatum]
MSKESLSNSPSHVEETEPVPQAEAAIEYDSNGLSGIVRSPYVLGAATLASLGGFSFGYDQGVISIILTMRQFHDQFPETAPGHPRYGFNVGFMTGMLELGAFVGCLFLPYLADRISRKWAMTVATVFFTVGAIIQTAAHNYGTLVAGRAIGGIGVGTLAMGAPLYISEISPPNLRGSLLVLEALSIVIGAIISYWITYGTKDMASEWSFRLPFLLQMPPALLVGLGIHFFPYSPRWLVMRQRDNDSLHALAQLRRVPATDNRVQAEWKGILTEVRFQQEILSQEHPNDNGIILELKQWGDLFRPRCLKRTAVALGIPFFQQFSGINAFVYYAPTFFKALGQDDNMALILSGMVNICQLAAGIPTFLYLDKMGRRKLAIFGGAAMAVPHLIMSGVVGKFDGKWEASPGMGWFGVTLIYIYVLCYACSYGPLAWTLPAEVFPSSRRAKGVGAATAMVWLANFIIGVVVPEMIIKIGWGTYLFFGIFCSLASVFSFFLVPETANKSLEQISELFGDHAVADEEAVYERIRHQVWASHVHGAEHSEVKQKKHLKCDNENPCANCKKLSISCARAKKFRIKKLITTENTFKFDPNQTWINTSNHKKSNAISFVDETNSASRHSRPTAAESPSSENGSQSESLDFAASVLQTLSKGNPQISGKHEASMTEELPDEPPDAFATSRSYEDGRFGASQDLSQLSLTSSPSGQSHLATNHYGEASLPVFSAQWQQSSPGNDTGKHPSGTDEQSPFGEYSSQLYQAETLPSMMDLELHNPTSLLSANSSQPLSLEEACLLRCFVEKLARAFDTTDRDHHYVSVLPLRAVHSPLLLNAICTASARFLTRVSSLRDPDCIIEYAGVELPDLSMESAIHYHNKCISHLMGLSADPINSCSDDALAAITILRYHEQVDTHFTGTDNETFSIAVRAVFQASQNDADGLLHLILQPPRGSDVYATSLSSLRFSACLIALRQEIWSVLMHRRPFRLPILPVENYGIFDDTLAADDYDWTNRVLIWCAHVLKLCYPDDNDEQPIDNRTRSQQWEAIKDFQRNWDEKRPPHFAPLYYRERNPSEGRYFPEYWITSPCQMLALQHIELARIVLAAHDTKIQLGIGGRAAHKALEGLMREATRRVCGLAMSQKWCQEGMVTAAVGLSMCGEYFQDPGEQAAIMELVTLLERDHAWPTSTLLSKLWDT